MLSATHLCWSDVGRISDEDLMDAMRRGYVAAFRWLKTADASQDACQEAARRALAAKDRFDDKRPFYPWFYKILRNLCFNQLSGNKRARSVGQALQHEPTAQPDRSAEQQLLGQERAASVARAIEALDESSREIIELRHFQDLSYEEIAEVLECPLGTVMSRLYTARKRLRAQVMGDPTLSGEEGA